VLLVRVPQRLCLGRLSLRLALRLLLGRLAAVLGHLGRLGLVVRAEQRRPQRLPARLTQRLCSRRVDDGLRGRGVGELDVPLAGEGACLPVVLEVAETARARGHGVRHARCQHLEHRRLVRTRRKPFQEDAVVGGRVVRRQRKPAADVATVAGAERVGARRRGYERLCPLLRREIGKESDDARESGESGRADRDGGVGLAAAELAGQEGVVRQGCVRHVELELPQELVHLDG